MKRGHWFSRPRLFRWGGTRPGRLPAGVLVLAFLFATPLLASAQKVTDSSYKVVAHIKADGTIQDATYKTIGHIKEDGTIQNASYRTVGHVKEDGTVQDASYRTIGHAGGIPLRWAAFYFFFNL